MTYKIDKSNLYKDCNGNLFYHDEASFYYLNEEDIKIVELDKPPQEQEEDGFQLLLSTIFVIGVLCLVVLLIGYLVGG